MSDLLADSEDLLAKISRSEIPQVRALQEPFSRAVNQMKEQLRSRAKMQHMRQDLARHRTETRRRHAFATALLTVGAIALLRIRSR